MRQQCFESVPPVGRRALEDFAPKILNGKREKKTHMNATPKASFSKKRVAPGRAAADRKCLRARPPFGQLPLDGFRDGRHALDGETAWGPPRWVDHVPT